MVSLDVDVRDSRRAGEGKGREVTYIHSSMGGRPGGFATRGDERSHNSSSISYRRAMTALSGTESVVWIHSDCGLFIGSWE